MCVGVTPAWTDRRVRILRGLNKPKIVKGHHTIGCKTRFTFIIFGIGSRILLPFTSMPQECQDSTDGMNPHMYNEHCTLRTKGSEGGCHRVHQDTPGDIRSVQHSALLCVVTSETHNVSTIVKHQDIYPYTPQLSVFHLFSLV